MGRKYTGWDGDAPGRRAGTEKLIQLISQHTGRALWNNGSWGVRKKRGKSSKSVHGTGRAFDMSWRNMGDSKGSGRYEDAVRVMEFLTRKDVADALGVEAVFDYFPGPHGRGWKCDREAWQDYTKPAFSGAPGGDWIHVELSPDHCDDPGYINHWFLFLWNGEVPVAAPAPAPAPAPQPVAEADSSAPAEKGTAWTGRSMRKGSRGERVKLVQQALNDKGHNAGPVDGKFGPKTDAAVKAFQQANQPEAGPVDGIVGKITWTVLFG